MGKDNPMDKIKNKFESADKRQRFIFPEYEVPTFSLGGATTKQDGNSYGVTYSAEEQATMDTVSKLRSELLSSLGLNSGGADDPYTQELMKESLRLSQPRLENALIGRGLGGSTIYKDSLTDLISKAGTNAILSGQQYKSNNLNALQNYLSNQNNLGQYLLSLQVPFIDSAYQKDLAQAMEDYRFAQQPSLKELAISKMMSIFDPGGSYMGFYNNPTQTSGQNAETLSGLGKAMQLYSAFQSMRGGMGGMGGMGSVGGATTTAPATTQSMGSLVDLYNNYYNNPYGFNGSNYSALTGKNY